MAYLKVTYKASLVDPVVVRTCNGYFQGYRTVTASRWHIINEDEIVCGTRLLGNTEFNSISGVKSHQVCKNCLKKLVEVEVVDDRISV